MKLKASELRQKSREELSTMLIDLSRERFTLQMQKGTGQLSKTAQVKKVRRDVARVQTVLNEMARAKYERRYSKITNHYGSCC